MRSYPEALELVYVPCETISDETIIIKSRISLGISTKTLRVEIIDPSFYTRVVNYKDISTWILEELESNDHEADPSSRTLLTTEGPLLKKVLTNSDLLQKPVVAFTKSRAWSVLHWFRGPTFMDSFVFSSTVSLRHSIYVSSVIQYLAATTFAFGSQSILEFYVVIGNLGFRVLLWESIKWILLFCLLRVRKM